MLDDTTTSKFFILYYHRSPANKYYVGITSKKSAVRRWNLDGSGYKNQPKFWRAIQKYGWDNFEHVILGTGLTKTEACDAEQFFIKLFDAKNNGYNADDGGEGSFGHTVSEAARQKMRECKLGKYTEAQKIGAISAANKHTKTIYLYSVTGELIETFFGYEALATKYNIPVSTVRNYCTSRNVYKNKFIFLNDTNIATLPLIIEAFKLQSIEKSLPTIGQYDLDGNYINSFLTYKEAAEVTEIPIGSISKVCAGFELQYKNFIFIKIKTETIAERLAKIKSSKKRHCTKKSYQIQQFDNLGNLIDTYTSYKEAVVATGLTKNAIIANCTNRSKTCGGFIFRKVLN